MISRTVPSRFVASLKPHRPIAQSYHSSLDLSRCGCLRGLCSFMLNRTLYLCFHHFHLYFFPSPFAMNKLTIQSIKNCAGGGGAHCTANTLFVSQGPES